MRAFDSRLEYVVSNRLFGQNDNNAIRMMLEENNIVDFKGLCYYQRDDLLSLTHIKDLVPISLTELEIEMILDIIHYSSSLN